MRNARILLAGILSVGLTSGALGCLSAAAEEPLQTLHGSCSLAPSTDGNGVRFAMNRGDCDGGGHGCHSNDSDIPLSSFTGFTLADLKNDGAHVDAVMAAEAGRITCSGSVHDLALHGEYTFVPNAAFVARMQQMGFSGFDSEKLQAYTLFHMETAWVQGLKDAGVSGMDSDNLIAMRIFKVDAAFVHNMAELGYPNLPADKLIAFKVHGVNADDVRQYRAMGYQPTGDELIQMRIFKITPDFIRRMQARKLNDLTISKLVQIRIFKLAE